MSESADAVHEIWRSTFKAPSTTQEHHMPESPNTTLSVDAPMDAMYTAWTIIANARDWLLTDDAQSAEWRAAAERWRDETFHPMLDEHIAARG